MIITVCGEENKCGQKCNKDWKICFVRCECKRWGIGENEGRSQCRNKSIHCMVVLLPRPGSIWRMDIFESGCCLFVLLFFNWLVGWLVSWLLLVCLLVIVGLFVGCLLSLRSCLLLFFVVCC